MYFNICKLVNRQNYQFNVTKINQRKKNTKWYNIMMNYFQLLKKIVIVLNNISDYLKLYCLT